MKCLLLLGAVALVYAKNDDLMRVMFKDTGCASNKCMGGCRRNGRLIANSQCSPSFKSTVAHSWNSMTELAKMLDGTYDRTEKNAKHMTGSVKAICSNAEKFERMERVTKTAQNKAVCFKKDGKNGENGFFPNKNKQLSPGCGWSESQYKSKQMAQETSTVPACMSWLSVSTNLWADCARALDTQSYDNRRGKASKYSLYNQMLAMGAVMSKANSELATTRAKLTKAQGEHKQKMEYEKKVILGLEHCQEQAKKNLSADHLDDFRYRMESIYLLTRDDAEKETYATYGGSDNAKGKADVWYESNRARTF